MSNTLLTGLVVTRDFGTQEWITSECPHWAEWTELRKTFSTPAHLHQKLRTVATGSSLCEVIGRARRALRRNGRGLVVVMPFQLVKEDVVEFLDVLTLGKTAEVIPLVKGPRVQDKLVRLDGLWRKSKDVDRQTGDSTPQGGVASEDGQVPGREREPGKAGREMDRPVRKNAGRAGHKRGVTSPSGKGKSNSGRRSRRAKGKKGGRR